MVCLTIEWMGYLLFTMPGSCKLVPRSTLRGVDGPCKGLDSSRCKAFMSLTTADSERKAIYAVNI